MGNRIRSCGGVWWVLPALVLAASPFEASEEFRRGDANDDLLVNLSDAICSLEALFFSAGCPTAHCLDTLDMNDDGQVDISDPISLLEHLFSGAPPLPPPSADGCGPDPTPDGLDCSYSVTCDGRGSTGLVVAPGLTLFSVWTERTLITTVAEQHALLSVMSFEPGPHRVPTFDSSVNAPGLIASLSFGPRLEPAEPAGGGAFLNVFSGESFRFTYRQDFTTVAGRWQLYMPYRGTCCDLPEWTCEFLNANDSMFSTIDLAAVLPSRVGVDYACFLPEQWTPMPYSPVTFTLEDGTRIAAHVEEGRFIRSLHEVILSRRIARAEVVFLDEKEVITDYGRLVYAAADGDTTPEYRVLFAEPIGGVHGFDLLPCPAGVAGCETGFAVAGSKAFQLDADFRRATEVAVASVETGA